MTDPLPVCPVLIGRETELATLRISVEDLADGQGGVILLSGEAGIGKSRLLQEFLAMPEAEECAIVQAICLESDRSEPYALALELANVAARSPATLPIGDAPEAERQIRRVQQALGEILERTANDRPLIVVAEDLHWSDEPSLLVLLGLALRPAQVLFVLTFRPEPPSPALLRFLAEINRLRVGQPIQLEPLGEADTARMIRAILQLPGPAPGALLDQVVAATDGIPFLIEELLRAPATGALSKTTRARWREAHFQVPHSLRQAIEGHLLSESQEVARVAELAAVLGQVVHIAHLRQLSRFDESSLLAALRALTDAQILVDRPDGQLAFRHALTRDAVLARLLDVERRALHRRVAALLEAEPETRPAALAYHWSSAGEIERAAPYALRAAERAAALHAHREALAHYQLALAGKAADRAALLTALGVHHAALAESEAAIAHYNEARTLALDAGDTVCAAELELQMGLVEMRERRRHAARQHSAAAFAGLPEDHQEHWRAGYQLALQLAAVGDYQMAEATLEEALQAARAANPLAHLRVTYELGGLRALRGDWPALEDAGATVLDEASGESDEGLALRYDAHAGLGSVAYYRGAFDVSLDHFRSCLKIGKQRGLVSDQALARWNLATNALYNLGRWREALEELAEMQALGDVGPADSAIWFEWWLEGRWEHALEPWLAIWPEMTATGDLELQMAYGRRIADIFLALGRPREALELVEGVLAQVRAVEARSFELQLVPREAEALAKLGEARADAVCETALALARALGARPAEGLLLRARALAHRAAGRWLKAFADFDAAAALLEALPMPYEVARTLREAGLARLARGRRGDRRRGAEHLRAARRLFADIGAGRDEAATDAILSAAGLAQNRERSSGPLTAREQEVAELVAEGLSNREIAEQLFIAEKTAAYHVSAILSKLDFTSRAQIAAHVTRLSEE